MLGQELRHFHLRASVQRWVWILLSAWWFNQAYRGSSSSTHRMGMVSHLLPMVCPGNLIWPSKSIYKRCMFHHYSTRSTLTIFASEKRPRVSDCVKAYLSLVLSETKIWDLMLMTSTAIPSELPWPLCLGLNRNQMAEFIWRIIITPDKSPLVSTLDAVSNKK